MALLLPRVLCKPAFRKHYRCLTRTVDTADSTVTPREAFVPHAAGCVVAFLHCGSFARFMPKAQESDRLLE